MRFIAFLILGLSLRNFFILLYFLVDFIVEIIVLNLCYFLFSRSHPCHQLSGSISLDIDNVKHLKTLYVFLFIFFFILEVYLLSFECCAAMTSTNVFCCGAIHNNNFHIIESIISTLLCHLLTPIS